MLIETVKRLPNSYLVNGGTHVFFEIGSTYLDRVEAWITAGGIVEVETLEESIEQKLQELTYKTKTFIYAEYPLEKQLNIGNKVPPYVAADLRTMQDFISSTLEKHTEIQEQIRACATVEEVQALDLDALLNA